MPLLERAFQELMREHRPSLVGEYYVNFLLSTACILGCNSPWLGSVHDLAQMGTTELRICVLLVLPSQRESQPKQLSEASNSQDKAKALDISYMYLGFFPISYLHLLWICIVFSMFAHAKHCGVACIR